MPSMPFMIRASLFYTRLSSVMASCWPMSLTSLGILHQIQGRFWEAEAVYRGAFEGYEKLGAQIKTMRPYGHPSCFHALLRLHPLTLSPRWP